MRAPETPARARGRRPAATIGTHGCRRPPLLQVLAQRTLHRTRREGLALRSRGRVAHGGAHAKGFLVGAERKGQIVEGFDFGNSPYSYMKEEFRGKEVVLTTTNGTKSIAAAKDADTVVIGALVNLDAMVDWLIKQNKNKIRSVDILDDFHTL